MMPMPNDAHHIVSTDWKIVNMLMLGPVHTPHTIILLVLAETKKLCPPGPGLTPSRSVMAW